MARAGRIDVTHRHIHTLCFHLSPHVCFAASLTDTHTHLAMVGIVRDGALRVVQMLRELLRDDLPFAMPSASDRSSKGKPPAFNFSTAMPATTNVKSVGPSRTQVRRIHRLCV
jgi:hypothetical protein